MLTNKFSYYIYYEEFVFYLHKIIIVFIMHHKHLPAVFRYSFFLFFFTMKIDDIS